MIDTRTVGKPLQVIKRSPKVFARLDAAQLEELLQEVPWMEEREDQDFINRFMFAALSSEKPAVYILSHPLITDASVEI